MLVRALLLGTAVTVLGMMPLASASAQTPMGFAGTFSTDYGQTSWSRGHSSTDFWGIDGAGAFGLGNSNLGAEVTGGFQRSWDRHYYTNLWGLGGSVFFAPGNMSGRFGGTFNYAHTTAKFDVTGNTEIYGGFGEYYASDMFTIGGKAGGWHATAESHGFHGSDNGSYFGGALTGYVTPNFELHATIDHIHSLPGNLNFTTYGVGAEGLFSEDVPISGFAEYTYGDPSKGHGHYDTWLFGVRLRTGPGTLLMHERNETLGWLSSTRVTY